MIYPWGDERRFNSYAGYFRRLFGGRVQKLSVDAGFSCPNRDGTIGKGGCTFCDNGAFTPSYCMPSKSIRQQIDEGIEFHRNRYRTARRYLVYFQSFSNTYAPLERLGAHFILGFPGETDEMLLAQTERINALPLTTVKFHQLQVFRSTPMAAEYDADPGRFRFWEADEYIDLFVEILRRLRPDLVVERFASEAPPRYHYGRNWGLIRNEQLLARLEKRLEERNAYQGEFFTIFAENNVE